MKNNLFGFLFAIKSGTIRKAFEEMGKYEYILSISEMALLDGMVHLLDVFNVFTIYVQGNQYPTINTMALFYTEMVDRLEEIKLFNTNEIIEKAADILLNKLPERIKLENDHIAAAIIDPRIQHLDIVNKWITENGIVYRLFCI